MMMEHGVGKCECIILREKSWIKTMMKHSRPLRQDVPKKAEERAITQGISMNLGEETSLMITKKLRIIFLNLATTAMIEAVEHGGICDNPSLLLNL